jgi:hypothetical protein
MLIRCQSTIQYAHRGFCLFRDTTADDFFLPRTNAVEVRDKNNHFPRDPPCLVVFTADQNPTNAVILSLKSVIRVLRGNAGVRISKSKKRKK